MRGHRTFFTAAMLATILMALLFDGCASGPIAGDDREDALCLPPGMAELPPPSAMLSAKGVRLFEGPGWLVYYRVAGKTVGVLWVKGELVAIDPDADDKAIPVWVRTGRHPCAWRSEIVGARRL